MTETTPRIAEVAAVIREARDTAREEFGDELKIYGTLHVLATLVVYYRKKYCHWDYKNGFPKEDE